MNTVDGNARSVSAVIGATLLALGALGEISTQIYLPALAEIAAHYHTDSASAQGSLWVFMIAFGAGQLLFGPASDHFGRRPVLLAGVGLYIAASLACVLAPSAVVFTAARFVQALGACAAFVGARAMVRDAYPLTRVPAMLASMTLALAIAVALAPTVGGALAEAGGWRATFYAMMVLGLSLWLLVAFRLPETRPDAVPDQAGTDLPALARDYVRPLKDAGFLANAVTLALVYGAMYAYVASAPFAVRQLLDVSAQTLGLIFGAILTGFIAGILVSRLAVQRIGPQRLIRIGTWLVLAFAMITGVGVWQQGPSLWSVVVPQVLLTLGAGLVLPNAVAAAIAPYGRQAGLAAAVVGFTQMLVGALAVVAVGILADGTVGPMLAVQLGCAVLAFGLYRLLPLLSPSVTVSEPG